MADELSELVERLKEAHGENLLSVLFYGYGSLGDDLDEYPKKILVVLDEITPHELRLEHEIAGWWQMEGNPLPVYFTAEEIKESSDVFPVEFLDMSHVRQVLYGSDPFESLTVPTGNLRHQVEYELRGKLLRLRRLYVPASHSPVRLAQLMSDSLDSFAVLFRHVLTMLGSAAPFEKHECVARLVETLGLDQGVIARIESYTSDDEVWLESEANQTFADYLRLIERVIDVVDDLPAETV
ncbi:MAG TPA: hypothetical protein VIG62_14195 [Blastocatellia bacterium]